MSTAIDLELRSQLQERRQRLEAAMATLGDDAYLRNLLEEVDMALARIREGTYGICEVCHQTIELGALMANPLLRVCLGDLSPAEQAALEDDLTLAARIQSELLPRRELRFDGWEVFTYYQPASVVSGDYCDVVTPETAGGELLFLIGDIAGHGVAASMLMAHLHAIFRSLMDVDAPVNKLVERANRVFAQSTISSYFATLVCGRANPAGEVELCNAGHSPPLLIGAGAIRSIRATGLPIGLFNFGQYSLTRVQLTPDEVLFLYTDGLTEAQNPAGEQYGMGRLERLVGSLGVCSPEAILRACLEDWNAFRAGASQQDDLTLMVIRRVA